MNSSPGDRPTQIGPYRILDELGAGGFGTVYAAEREVPVRQRVALKVLKAGMDSELILTRFAVEREAMARMDHPNIAKVFDSGVGNHRSYIAMEWIDGAPITDFCERAGLGTNDRLEIFADVCRGVHHAHQKGVVHRDLKPANILVTSGEDGPLAKIIDFGVAKALHREEAADPLLTMPGSTVGTIEYMSPEQADPDNLDIDTRSDVFSLGVVLYELLSGTLPFPSECFRGKSPAQIEAVLREEDPPRPSTRRAQTAGRVPRVRSDVGDVALSGQLPRDLDWITMKALRKDREERYPSAHALAADIERYLTDRPVLARPPSVRDQAVKFARRYRAQVTAAGAILLALLLGLAGASWSLAAATRALQDAEDARLRERQATDPLRVEDLLHRARQPWPRRTDHGAGDNEEARQWRAWVEEADDVLARISAHEVAAASRGSAPEGATSDGRVRLRTDRLRGMLDQVPKLEAWRADVAARRAIMATHGPLWSRCRDSLVGVEAFAGIDLQPLPYLIPLGIDADRNRELGRQEDPLWVFAVGGTGQIPRWVDATGAAVPYGQLGRAEIGDDTALLLVLVPGGRGWIGGQMTDPDGPNYEQKIVDWSVTRQLPVYQVDLKPFFVAKTEVTNEQYMRFVAATGQRTPDLVDHPTYGGVGRPVVSIEVEEAKAFCAWIGLRLPSEAEWEYSCRAGTETRFWFGHAETELAKREWVGRPARRGGGPHRVASPPSGRPSPNPWGLHDLHGNAAEWCADEYFEDHRGAPTDGRPRLGSKKGWVWRGGAWEKGYESCRSAFRDHDIRFMHSIRSMKLGMRPVRGGQAER